ncbi:MAG: sensor histidine kinase [Paracoccaceae bacterium]
MRYLTKLTLTFTGLFAVALACAWLAFWSASSAQSDLERMHLASRVNEAYLSLSNHTYRLFKQFGDAFLIGDRDGGAGEEALVAAIRADVTLIRELIAEEVRLYGEEEIEELDHLAKIERKIDALIRELTWLQTDDNLAGGTPYDVRLARILDQRIDTEFETLIGEALAEERSEVAEVEADLRAAVEFHQQAALGAGAVAATATVLGTWLLGSGLLRPLRLLLDGARAVGQGELGHRIARSGDADLDRVAAAFNRMADRVAEREDRLRAARRSLEREVSERTRRLESLLETLRRAEANRRRLLADVSHELRTPLTIIRGEVDVTLRGARTVEDYREALVRAGRAAAHSARIVDDLLFVARQESDEVRLRYDEVDVVALAEEAASLAAALSDTGSRPRVEASSRPIVVVADPDRLRQVLAILLENAVRYGGDAVAVRVGHAGDGVALVVADNGPGLGEEEAARAFERFFRGTDAAARHEGGTGLGLPVAKAIVEAHGGTIALDTRPGEGVEVRVVLPERVDMAEAS